MAFRMNRPIIKGTANHKASIAKAKAKSVVSQSRTKADAGLIAASNALGKSYKPSEIDFELDKINIDVPEKEKKEKQPRIKKEKQPRVKKEKKVLTEEEKAERRAKRRETRGKIVDGVKTAIGGIVGVPLAIGKGLFKFGEDIIDEFGNKVKGAIDDIKTKGAEGKEKRAKIKAEKEAAALAEQKASEEARFNELMVEDEEENDFSAIEAEPDVVYESSGDVDRGYKTWKHKQDAENIRSARETSGRMNTVTEQQRQEAAKKYNVKVEDLEAKEIGGKREFFPKQGAVGGGYGDEGGGAGSGGTQWDDELGRFRIPMGGLSDEALANLSDEDKKVYKAEMEERAKKEEAELEALKPKIGDVDPSDVNSTMINEGQIELDPVTNTYRYTELYHKTKAKIAEQNKPKVEPVVEEKKTLSNLEIRKKKRADKKWNDPKTSQYIKDQMLKEGYVPDEGKTAMNMRDNRIYRNAVKGGIVQQNMIKSGYIPE